eukprot:TRINITY_DN6505_c1_g2_i1.p1 TRINITY_DN6505_c1_g2~~TRINITY_DN6505_c1_g2_i1.p1  ORF type:complete len:197 (+),score=59.67 TRINITY_DN6505_c1_g2_i1:51-641(+)
MAQTGVVRSWNKGYGFIEGDDSKCVFVHKSSLPDGARLWVGKQVSFDAEDVEGHDGRKKGSNVTGEGVVSWEDWKKSAPTKDQREQEKSQWEAFKKDKLEYDPAKRPPQKEVELRVGENGKGYTKEQFKKHFGGTEQWDKAVPYSGKGHRGKGGRGKGGVERRPDTDGEWYTKAQFKEYYGGYFEWDISGRMIASA